MSYKIYAKKGRKVMPIKVEEKHIYSHVQNDNDLTLKVFKPVANVPVVNVRGYGVSSANVHILHTTDNTVITQGPAENQRIGNKVNIKSISLTFKLYFNSPTLIANFSHGEMMNTWFNFRLMVVKFKDAKTSTDIAQWFRESYIYYSLRAVSDGNYPVQSNWMDKLRESTPYTGSFKILYDKKFTLNKVKSVRQKNILIPFNGQVNFENTYNRPTDNQTFNHIYTILITPSSNRTDMDPVSADKCTSLADDSANLFYYNANIKTIYYDV